MASNDVIVRLRMLGATAFKAAADTAASSVRGIGDAADTVTKKGGKLNGALSGIGTASAAIGRAAMAGGAALGAAGVAAVGMGIKFDAGMEQSQVAFENLLGSAEKGQDMLDRLYKIASKTPFEFPQLRDATQRLLGFGMAAEDVVPTMTAVGDAVAAAGGSSEQIDKVSTALGQIQAKGKVSTEELLQMAESGVPAMKILADQMGITGAELSDKLRAGAIDADKGISALVTGMNKRYGGMAAAQSKTFSGMISTLKDNANQILGTIMQPLFKFLRDKVLPKINEVTEAIGKWAQGGGVAAGFKALQQGFKGQDKGMLTGASGVFAKIGTFAGKGFEAIKGAFLDLWDALKPAQPFLQNVLLPLFKGLAMGVGASVVSAFKVLVPIIKIAATVLGWIGEKAKPISPLLEKIGFVIGFLYSGPILKAISGLGKLGGIFKVVAAAAKIAAVPIKILTGVFKGLISIIGKLFGVLGKLGPLASKGFQALLRPFKSIGSKFLDFGKAIIEGIANGVKSAPGAILDAIKSIIPGGKVGSLIRKAIPGLQYGGMVTRPGLALVGEAGPELVNFNAPARVAPLPSPTIAPIFAGAGGGGDVRVPVYLDGRVITEVVAKRTSDKRARR